MDNAGEFTSKSFDTYCASLRIEVEHLVAYVHTQNGLVESLIKHIQIIARTLLLRTNLNDTTWGHAVMHAAAVIRLRPTASLLQSPIQMVLGYELDIAHLRRLGIFVGFNSPSIIRFLEPTTGDLFTARFVDCHFNEIMFPSIGTPKIEMAAKQKPVTVFSWNEKNLSQFDPRTHECKNKVQRIIHLQSIANRLPDAFNDATKITKSHIPAVNAPSRIVVPEGQAKMDENPPQLKRGRPIGSKDTVPRKRRGKNQESTPEEPGAVLTSKELNALEEAQTHEKITNPRNTENSITYCNEIWDRNKIIIDDIFAFSVAHKIMDDECEPQSIIECRQMQDCSKWEEAIKAELASLAKREVFGPITRTPDNVKPVGYKWVFVQETK